jgi:hypothetical protein
MLVLAALVLTGGCSPVETGLHVSPGGSADTLHDKCAETLEAFVDASGMVDYKRLREGIDELGLLLKELGRVDAGRYGSWSREDKIAFWINTYNLQKLKIVVENYPIVPSSGVLAGYWGQHNIRHIEAKITSHRFPVMNEQLTFAEIERRFFSDRFDDPRVFFALTSASLSSPPLRNEPYYGHKLDEQLDDQIRTFLSSPAALGIDRENRTVYLSAMFELSSRGKEIAEKFGTDDKFKGHPPATRAALNLIANYISPNDTSFLEMGDFSVKYMKHDWTINDGS